MTADNSSVELPPMEEVELELPWIRDAESTERHCMQCDPAAGLADPIEPPGGEQALMDDADLF